MRIYIFTTARAIRVVALGKERKTSARNCKFIRVSILHGRESFRSVRERFATMSICETFAQQRKCVIFL